MSARLRVKRGLASALFAAVAAAGQSVSTMQLEQRVVEFAPTRTDLSVGIVWLSILAPDKGWKVTLPPDKQADVQDSGTVQYVELTPAGKNRFTLPALKIAPTLPSPGTLCVSLKAWLNEVPNEVDWTFWANPTDRYSLATFCTGEDARARARYSQNRLASFEQFQRMLMMGTIPVRLSNEAIPWRPAILVDQPGNVYFQSLLVGRHTPGALSHHLAEAWKLTADGRLTRIELPERLKLPSWGELVRQVKHDPYSALLQARLDRPVARGRNSQLYVASHSCDEKDASPGSRLLVLDARGLCRAVALPAGAAALRAVTAITTDPVGQILFAWTDTQGRASIWRLDGSRTATALVATGSSVPSALAADSKGTVYYTDPAISQVRVVDMAGSVTSHPSIFVQPTGLAVGPGGDIYVLDGGTKLARVHRIRMQDGKVEELATVTVQSRREAPVQR